MVHILVTPLSLFVPLPFWKISLSIYLTVSPPSTKEREKGVRVRDGRVKRPRGSVGGTRPTVALGTSVFCDSSCFRRRPEDVPVRTCLICRLFYTVAT